MINRIGTVVVGGVICAVAVVSQVAIAELPVHVPEYAQQVHVAYTVEEGLPAEGIEKIAQDSSGTIYAMSRTNEIFVLQEEEWSRMTDSGAVSGLFSASPEYASLEAVEVQPDMVRAVAALRGEIAVAASTGLYVGDGNTWELALPTDGHVRWAPIDIRAVNFDSQGRLWFASPQGVGCRISENTWELYTGADGLPFNEFTCMATASSGVWFGTTNGAIQFSGGKWRFRQGRRWLVDNYVNDIVIDEAGDAWIATNGGVSQIQHKVMTLSRKALYYEEEVEKYHRRTTFGYVNPATLSVPGDKSTAKARFSDNDGSNIGRYLGAMSFAYASTGEEKYQKMAHDAFKALAFLGEVTQGGQYGGPEGLIARNVVPTTELDPGTVYDKNYDIRRQERDTLWRIMERRVPVDKTGQWYWKADSSSDELDGHFFGSAIYFDRVCKTEEEKNAVRTVVRRIIDHLIKHDYTLVDYDGEPTRWGHFSPDDLNRDPNWKSERGLNSYSILTYLSIAHHVLGEQKYRDEMLKLALDHGYGMNGMTQPKELPGPNNPGHQPDDNMAFMNYYHLIRYETDPMLLSMFQYAIREHWKYEKFERNSFTNFVYGAVAGGKSRTDNWRTVDLSPPLECYTDAIDTLKRYPLDLIEWPMSNAHRIDMIPMGGHGDGPSPHGSDPHGYVFPIDERPETYWHWDYWKLSNNGNGTNLRPPHHYLLAYYMGCFHGFVEE